MDHLLYLMFRCDEKFGKFGGIWNLSTPSDEQPLLRRPHQTVRTLGLRFLLRGTAAEVKDL